MFKSKYDKLFFISLLPASITIIGLLILFLIVLVSHASTSIGVFGLKLFIESVWNPESEMYGILPPIIGTFVTSGIAVTVSLLFSIPLSIFTVEFIGGRTRELVTSLVEMMSGVPTVIYAIWSLNTLAFYLKIYIMEPLYKYLSFIPLFSCKPITGLSVFTAGIAIGIALTPYMTMLIAESYRSIPIVYREGCLSIGATRYETVKILLSLSKPAIVASTVLGFARAAGETTIAAVTVGNSMSLSWCLFAPSYTVPAIIASQYANAGLYVYAESVLHASAMVILIATLILSFIGLKILDEWRRRVVV